MEMAVLKSNLCPTCGGLLDIDIEKQMYVCAFCGVSFDYEYFREDNVKEVAYKALLRNEYGSAKDAYDFVLAKDPHDFDALRGLFLCKVKWTDMKQMFNDSEVQVTANDPALTDAIEKCLPEHKPYFEKIREALNELRHYRDLKTEAKVINEKRDKTKKAMDYAKQADASYVYNRAFERYRSEWLRKHLNGILAGCILLFALRTALKLRRKQKQGRQKGGAQA